MPQDEREPRDASFVPPRPPSASESIPARLPGHSLHALILRCPKRQKLWKTHHSHKQPLFHHLHNPKGGDASNRVRCAMCRDGFVTTESAWEAHLARTREDKAKLRDREMVLSQLQEEEEERKWEAWCAARGMSPRCGD